MATILNGLLVELAEKLARPGLLGLAGKRIEKRCQQDLERYFRALTREILALHLENLVEHATKEIARHAVQIKLANVLRNRSHILQALLEMNIQAAMLAGDRVHHFAEADGADEPDPESFTPMLSSDEAALYASIHAGEQVAGINATTQRLIADVIETGIEDSFGVPGTARLLRQTLDQMSKSRSWAIASTEMNDAFSEAAIRKLDRLGIEYKRWITSPDACPVCEENEDAGPIPVDDEFPSGDERPPAHVNCRCALVGARAPVAA